MENKRVMRIFIIGMYDEENEPSSAKSIVYSTTSYEGARKHVLDSIDRLKQRDDIADLKVIHDEKKYHWIVRYKPDGFEDDIEMCYRIEPIDLELADDVPEPRRPELEKRCEVLEKVNDGLKRDIAECKKAISAAQCWLTFYDGGIYEDFDHILQNMRTAKQVLEMGKSGNTHILELFENWKKHDEEKK